MPDPGRGPPDAVYLNPEDPLNTVTARSASRPAEAVA